MPKLQKIPLYAFAYLSWIFSLLLFLWFILISRNTLLAYLRNYWAMESFQRQMSVNFIDRMYIMLIGVTWIIFMIVVESYFRTGIAKGNLPRRVSRVIGPLLIAILVIDLIMIGMAGIASQSWSIWVVALVELLAGAGLIWYGWSPKAPLILNREKKS